MATEGTEAVVAAEETQPTAPASQEPPKTPTAKKEEKKKSKKDKSGVGRFAGPGVSFRGKLIGISDVPEPRGDIMCQQAMQRLKEGVKQAAQHKQKVVVNVSLVGLQIIDANSMAPCHRHPVHRISFISRDITDTRAFGYIFGDADGSHKFFAIKTEKAAEQLVLALRDLFQCVFELKKKEMEEAKLKQEGGNTENINTENTYDVPSSNAPVSQTTENGGDAVYAVPGNNGPVEAQTGGIGNLLDLQSELNTIQQGIEQMDAFGDSFFNSQSPTQTTSDPWGTQATPQPTTPANDPFVVQIQTQRGYEFDSTFLDPVSPAQPASPANQFGAQFGNTAPPQQTAGFNAFNTPQPQMQPTFNAFNTPQPAAGMNAFPNPNQPFAATQAPAQQPFQNDPFFSGQQQPMIQQQQQQQQNAMPGDKYSAFSGMQPPAPAPAPVPIDPFASMPAADLLQPMQLQSSEPEPEAKAKSSDFFGDLCDIGSTRPATNDPFMKRDPFAEARAASAPKQSLNQLRNPNATPNITMATPESDPFSIPPSMPSNQMAAPQNPFGTAPVPTNNAPDPFAQFAANQMSAAPAAPAPSSDPFADFLSPKPQGIDDFSLPQPNQPPPPVPSNNQLDLFNTAPVMPPRPSPGGQGMLQGPPAARPRPGAGEAPVPRPRASVRQNGAVPANDPFNVFDAPGQTSTANPFDTGASQPEEPVYAVVNKPKKS